MSDRFAVGYRTEVIRHTKKRSPINSGSASAIKKAGRTIAVPLTEALVLPFTLNKQHRAHADMNHRVHLIFTYTYTLVCAHTGISYPVSI